MARVKLNQYLHGSIGFFVFYDIKMTSKIEF